MLVLSSIALISLIENLLTTDFSLVLFIYCILQKLYSSLCRMKRARLSNRSVGNAFTNAEQEELRFKQCFLCKK